MNLIKAVSCCVIASAAQPIVALAQDTGYNNPCAGIQWNHKILAEYPKAPVGCQTIETKDGVKYAVFKGDVVTLGADSVTANMVNVAGTPIGAIAWRTSADEPATINNKEGTVGELKKGDTVMLYIAEKTYTVHMHPGSKALPIMRLGGPVE
jgi:hypothetical protein